MVAAGTSGADTVLTRLIETGADIDSRDKSGASPLMRAAARGDAASATRLLNAGAAVNVVGPLGSAFELAAVNDDLEMAALLLDHGADIEIRFEGSTELIWAVVDGRFEMTQLLLSRGADVRARSDEGLLATGSTALHASALTDFGHAAIAELLLEAGADVKAIDAQGRTALEVADQYENHLVLELLQARAP